MKKTMLISACSLLLLAHGCSYAAAHEEYSSESLETAITKMLAINEARRNILEEHRKRFNPNDPEMAALINNHDETDRLTKIAALYVIKTNKPAVQAQPEHKNLARVIDFFHVQ